jgi:dihydrolipoamide dehydrogenase
VSDHTVDVAVVGGGPGGYATALRAAGHGLSVALVEAGLLGGTCLHRGCVPSKALLHVAALADAAASGPDVGVRSSFAGIDPVAAGAFRDGVVGRLHRGLEAVIRARGITVVAGTGRVVEPGRVLADGPEGPASVRARHVVLATGSEPATLGSLPVDGRVVLSSDHALRLPRIPRRALVAGAGAVGMEFASLWRSFGAEVTIVEAGDRLLPLEDPRSSRAVQRAFVRRGIAVHTGRRVVGAKILEDGAAVELDDGTGVEVDTVLVAVGRRPQSAGSGADELGVLDGRGYVTVDGTGRTAVPGVWAVGDVTDTLALAHAAFSEGFVVADTVAGLAPAAVDHRNVPRVTYCRPEVASVGWTEEAARRAGLEVTATTESLAGNARAIIEGEDGLVTLVTAAATGELLGAHLVGPAATELVAEVSLAVAWAATVTEIGDVTHPHPSLAESVHETALAASGHPFHAL